MYGVRKEKIYLIKRYILTCTFKTTKNDKSKEQETKIKIKLKKETMTAVIIGIVRRVKCYFPSEIKNKILN